MNPNQSIQTVVHVTPTPQDDGAPKQLRFLQQEVIDGDTLPQQRKG